ncbi:MAG: type II toxin-antitoxin system RelE/ParE family toxin [Candidatus Aminicenantes bacterium]|nr:type II toxin-antitoxin system RelE/ParE family toxin [Candidatus Aminicenantes bacterium]
MDYNLTWHEDALKDLRAVDKSASKKIIEKIKTYFIKNPVNLGKPLKGNLKGLYRYRFGDYRIIYTADLTEREITILTVKHRRKVYKQ